MAAKMYKPFRVKLDTQDQPVMIMAETTFHARQLAHERYRGRVQWVGQISKNLLSQGATQ
jgi:hypothetical protein